MTTVTLKVPNIHCRHCVMTIQREIAPLDGVESVKGDVETKTVTLSYWGEGTLAKVKETLAEIGYPVAD